MIPQQQAEAALASLEAVFGSLSARAAKHAATMRTLLLVNVFAILVIAAFARAAFDLSPVWLTVLALALSVPALLLLWTRSILIGFSELPSNLRGLRDSATMLASAFDAQMLSGLQAMAANIQQRRLGFQQLRQGVGLLRQALPAVRSVQSGYDTFAEANGFQSAFTAATPAFWVAWISAWIGSVAVLFLGVISLLGLPFVS